jgi:hypothetical protein
MHAIFRSTASRTASQAYAVHLCAVVLVAHLPNAPCERRVARQLSGPLVDNSPFSVVTFLRG